VVVEPRGGDQLASQPGSSGTTPGFLATQADIIASERVGARAVAALKLAADPRWAERWQKASGGQGDANRWIAGRLKKNVKVSPSHESNVLTLTVTADDPRFAADYANALARAYLETDLELRVEPARQSAVWFDEHTRQLRGELEGAQARLAEFQRANGLVGDDKLDLESARLAELSTQLTAAQAQTSEASSRQRQGGGMNDVTASPLIQALKVDLARQEAKLIELAGYLGENHPQYQRVKGEVDSLRARLRAESGQVAAVVGTNSRINQAREGDIRARLDAQKQRVLELKRQRDEMGVLLRESTAPRRPTTWCWPASPRPAWRASRARATWPCCRRRWRPPRRPARGRSSTWGWPSSSAACSGWPWPSCGSSSTGASAGPTTWPRRSARRCWPRSAAGPMRRGGRSAACCRPHGGEPEEMKGWT
jgi:chain length determinant protein EpsF